MRTLLCTAAMALAAASLAQEPFYRRVGADGPAVPDGGSYCLDVTASGWALIRTEASNLLSPATFGPQFFLRSPLGTLEHVPLPTWNSFVHIGAVSEDGATVVLSGIGGTYLGRRNASGFEFITTSSLLGSYSRVALSPGGAVFPLYNGLTMGYDFATDQMALLPRVGFKSLYPEQAVGIGTNGRWSVWNARGGYVWVDIPTGSAREWKTGASSDYPGNGTIEPAGQAVWAFLPGTSAAAARFARHDFFREETESFPVPGIASATPVGTAGRRLYFLTATAVDSDDTNNTGDLYAFDRVSREIELISRRKGSRLATGGVNTARISPKGDRAYFSSTEPGVTEEVTVHTEGSLYVRALPTGQTQSVLAAAGPSGNRNSSSLLSSNGRTVLLADPVYERNLENPLRVDVDGRVTQIAVERGPVQLRDISDDGHVALWTGSEGKVRLWIQGREVITLASAPFTAAFWDAKSKRAVLMLLDPANGSSRLCAYRPIDGAIEPLAAVNLAIQEFDVAGGRVAYRANGAITLRHLTTGETATIPLESNRAHLGPRLTADGVYVSVATYATLSPYGDKLYGRYFRARDGEFRRKTPFGLALRDSNWIVDPDNYNLIYAPTGAVLDSYLSGSLSIQGPVVGPPQLYGDFLYRAKVSNVPIVQYLTAVPRSGGRLSLHADIVKAGLENADTWAQYRIDGGPWSRLETLRRIEFTLPDGPHRLEIQGRDALGRTGDSLTRRFTTDSVAPIVGTPRAVATPEGVWITVPATGGSSSILRIGGPPINRYTNDAGPNSKGFGVLLTELKSGSTYRFSFLVRDAVSNETASPEITFTMP
ncbi:hypothetical protein EON81_09605 [bacterium]|nr:MAG: hypothetical protein EON81_09605 [bacterium]